MPDPALNSTWKANAKPIITTVRIKVKRRTPDRIIISIILIGSFEWIYSYWTIIFLSLIGSFEWIILIGS